MLIVVDTPVIEKKYTPQGSTEQKSYTFNTVGVLDNIYIGVESYQMPLSYIDGTTYATIHTPADYTAELNQVKNELGEIIVYIYDNYEVGYNYSGRYRLENIIYENNETTASLYFIDNEGPTFFGNKYFPDTTYSQVSYKYRNQITFNIYDYTQLGSSFVDKLITSVVQNMSANGINYINLSEIALSYVNQTGCRMIRISVTEVDYFGNTSTLQGRPMSFIYGSLPEVNYYNYILFNPINGGQFLPTISDRLFYNNKRIYPFYVNFLLQDIGIAKNDYVLKIVYKTYLIQNGVPVVQNIIQDNIIGERGLNIIDISTTKDLVNVINENINYITFQIVYEKGLASGQFTTQFTEEFVLAGKIETGESVSCKAKLEYRVFNDRRDFYLRYNNGIGGWSTILSTNYEESITPEIISLRNREVLNNIVVRSTEVMNVTFDQLNLDRMQEILGFEPSYMFKVNGIYESNKLTRIGADLSEKEYIIRSATYNKDNQELYNTVKIELFRPMNSGFQQIGSVNIDMKLNTEGGETNLINNSYFDNGKNICHYGNILGTPIIMENSVYTLIAKASYQNNLDNSASMVVINESNWTYSVAVYFMKNEGIKTKMITGNLFTVGKELVVSGYNREGSFPNRGCEDSTLTVYWVFVCEGNGSNFKFWTPPLAEQESSGQTTIEVELKIDNISNLMVTSYGFTTQSGDDFNTYEFYDNDYFQKQLIWVKTEHENMMIQSFVRTSQGVRYGKQLTYKS